MRSDPLEKQEKQLHGCNDRELQDSIAPLAATIARSQRDLLRYVRELDQRQVWASDGCRNMGQWLAPRFGISVTEGTRWTHAAHALEHLPLTSVAFERGRVSLGQVLQLTRFATGATEKELLRYARRASLNALRKKADLATRPPLEEHIENHHARYLELRRFNDGGAIYLEGLLPADEGAMVAKALRHIVDQLPEMPAMAHEVPAQEVPDWARATGIEDFPAETVFVRDGLPQRMADALVVLASGHVGARHSDPATVVVSTSLQALQSDDRGCDLEGAGAVHPEIARRISCDCRLQFVVRDGNHRAVGIGRASRNIPGYLRREMLQRDDGCTFPGCGTNRYVDGHHIRHWSAGGTTDLYNLTTTCHFHHKLVHEFGWSVYLDQNQIAHWLRPDGRRYEPGPLTADPALH